MTPAAGVLRCAPEEAVSILANWSGPASVPVLGTHHGAAVGWVKQLMRDGSDVWFVAALDDVPAAERLLSGPVAVSVEMLGRGVTPHPDERGIVLPVSTIGWPATFHGSVGPGWTLTGIAMLPTGHPPGAPGSAMWVSVP